MKPEARTDADRQSLLKRNLVLVVSYLAVMLIIAGAYL